MFLKTNNAFRAPLQKILTHRHFTEKRVWFFLGILLFTAGFYFGGYTSVPDRMKSQIKEMRHLNLLVGKNYIRGKMSKPRKITIDIKHKDYQYLEYKRAEALKRGVIITDDSSYVPARVMADGKTARVRIRLKGDFTDHLKGEKWSFRIKVKGENAIWGMRRFSLQAPERSGWGHEWVMYQWFKKEDLISLRYDMVELILNGRNLGVYALEESFSKELLENNQRREGPILKWDESLLFDDQKSSRGDTSDESDLYYAADITSFTTNKVLSDETLHNNFLVARSMLTELRNGQVDFSEVFDVERAAKTLAIVEISNALHALRWKNCRFYFNPITNRLELIAYNAYSESPIARIDENSIPLYTAYRQNIDMGGVRGWYHLYFGDKEFVKHYFAALDRFTSPGYLESFFKDISDELGKIESAIFIDYPTRHILVPVYLQNRDTIRSFLYPKQPLKAYLKDYDGEKIRLSVANTMFLPAAIDGIYLTESGQMIVSPTELELEGKQMGQPLKYTDLEISAAGIDRSISVNERSGDAITLGDIQLKYHIPGLRTYRLAQVDAYNLTFIRTKFSSEEGQRRLKELSNSGVIQINEKSKEINFNSGKWTIDNDIIIPEGYKAIFPKGTQIILNKNAAMFSYGPVIVNGTGKQPVTIKSNDGTGQGFVVLSANDRSKLSHVIFDSLRAVSRKDWHFYGAVTFYESTVDIDHAKFSNNDSEDQLNIVRSKFRIRNSQFSDSFGDALDVDFGEGILADCIFESCGNDCLDFSGSKADIKRTDINGAGDKGMSIGEKSLVRIADSSLSNAVIALASKDMSTAIADHLRISNSEIGFAAYQKKPEYGGARIEAKDTTMIEVNNKYVGDKQSQIVENGTEVRVSFSNDLLN